MVARALELGYSADWGKKRFLLLSHSYRLILEDLWDLLLTSYVNRQ